MKTMTCKQLGGGCDIKFHAQSFEEIATLSKQHGTAMFQKGDEAHLIAMKELMKSPAEMQKWFENKKKEFDELPDEQ